MQSYLLNIRLVMEQNTKFFNRTYTGMVDECLKETKYNNFILLINEVKDKIEQVQENIVMSKYGIVSSFFLTNEDVDHIDSLRLRYMKGSMGSIADNFMQLNVEITRTVTIKKHDIYCGEGKCFV
ncbi:hypothetical protein CVS40_12128 [Lucilia cuprina]|nr:hypothetical protein CVS40_12128 [Lucilia cuprina]